MFVGHKQPFSDAMRKGHIRMISSEQTINKMTTIRVIKKVAVDYVVHPMTRTKVDYNQAILEGEIYLLACRDSSISAYWPPTVCEVHMFLLYPR